MKKNNGKKSNLQQLADALDLMDPKDLSDQSDTTPIIKNKRENRELCWRSRAPVKPVGFGSESFELVVLPCGDATRLLRFMGQLDGMLHDPDSYGDILRTAHTWDRGTVVTIQMQPTKLSNLAIKLAILPEVEKVEDELSARSIFSSTTKKFRGLPASSIRPSKRIHVTLKEPILARQEPELVPVLA